MPEHRKMANFVPINADRSLSAEFDCWHPVPEFAYQEQDGASLWKGATLTAIPAEAGVEPVDLPKQLEYMVKHCWQKASAPSDGAARGRVQIAGGPQNRLDVMFKSRNIADIFKQAEIKETAVKSYKPAVQPLKEIPGMCKPEQAYLHGIANDWKLVEQLKRISAYTFRGDRRLVLSVKADGGFNPPISRTDAWYVDNVIFPHFASYMKRRFDKEITKALFDQAYNLQPAGPEERKVLRNFVVWRMLVETESYHVGRMLACEALKGYTSTTRAVTIAKHFGNGGYVYLTLVRGGYLVPDRNKHEWTTIFGEQEVAFPGSVPWADVFAFRHVKNKMFAGPIYIRKGFDARNLQAFRQCYDLMSGKVQ
jgi:hypothetical protein